MNGRWHNRTILTPASVIVVFYYYRDLYEFNNVNTDPDGKNSMLMETILLGPAETR